MSHSFQIGNFDRNFLSSSDLARILFNTYKIEDGFVCSCMAYMSNYQQTYKFSTAEELQKALDLYCNQNDTSNFDYYRLYICFRVNNHLIKITFRIQPTSGFSVKDERVIERVIEVIKRNIGDCSPNEGRVFKQLFHTDEEIIVVEPPKVFLPPY